MRRLLTRLILKEVVDLPLAGFAGVGAADGVPLDGEAVGVAEGAGLGRKFQLTRAAGTRYPRATGGEGERGYEVPEVSDRQPG